MRDDGRPRDQRPLQQAPDRAAATPVLAVERPDDRTTARCSDATFEVRARRDPRRRRASSAAARASWRSRSAARCPARGEVARARPSRAAALAARGDGGGHRLRPRRPQAQRDPADALRSAEPLGRLDRRSSRARRAQHARASAAWRATPIERFAVKTSSLRDADHHLSGGNQQKVVLGRCFALAPRRARAQRADPRDRRRRQERDLPADPGHGRGAAPAIADHLVRAARSCSGSPTGSS